MNLSSKIGLSFCIALFLVFGVYGQNSRSKLERQKKDLNKEINYKNELLKEIKRSKSNSLSKLTLYNKKIANRERLIQALKTEVDLIDRQIGETKNEITAKENELKMLKDEYAKMIYYAYKTRSSYDKIMFIFASEDFNQAYKRLKYLNQYAQFRQRQAEMIVQTQQELNNTIALMEEQKIQKELVIKSKEQEKINLSEDKNESQKVYNDLKSKEKELRKEIKKKEKEAKKLQRAIQKIIEESMKTTEKGTKGYVLTPEAKALSANFENNKGKLPWPTAKGIVTGYYGKHQHPTLRGIYINNNGIDISTEKGAKARSVFNGEVSGVIVLPGMGKAVMVRHGAYISVYSNLKEVFVQKGDKVDLKQAVGIARTDDAKGVTEVHFELWKGQTTLNPAAWLYKFK